MSKKKKERKKERNRIRLIPLLQTRHVRHNRIQHDFPTSPSNTQSKCPNDSFYGSKPKRSSSCVMAQNTHTACVEKQVGMRVPAQINIWLTLQSGYYLVEISEREVWGVSLCFFFLFFFLWVILVLPPCFSIAAGTQVSLAVTQHLPRQ